MSLVHLLIPVLPMAASCHWLCNRIMLSDLKSYYRYQSEARMHFDTMSFDTVLTDLLLVHD